MKKIKRSLASLANYSAASPVSEKRAVLEILPIPTPSATIGFPSLPQPTIPSVSGSTTQKIAASNPGAQAGAKTGACTPSPTKNLAPSASTYVHGSFLCRDSSDGHVTQHGQHVHTLSVMAKSTLMYVRFQTRQPLSTWRSQCCTTPLHMASRRPRLIQRTLLLQLTLSF